MTPCNKIDNPLEVTYLVTLCRDNYTKSRQKDKMLALAYL